MRRPAAIAILAVFVFLLGFSFVPSAHAQSRVFPTGYWGPLLSCTGNYAQTNPIAPDGVTTTCNSFCDLLHTTQNVVDFSMSAVLFIGAPAMILFGGILLLLSGTTLGGEGDKRKMAKDVIVGAVIGVFVVLGAYLVVGTFLWLIGNGPDSKIQVSWPNIKCELPPASSPTPGNPPGPTGKVCGPDLGDCAPGTGDCLLEVGKTTYACQLLTTPPASKCVPACPAGQGCAPDPAKPGSFSCQVPNPSVDCGPVFGVCKDVTKECLPVAGQPPDVFACQTPKTLPPPPTPTKCGPKFGTCDPGTGDCKEIPGQPGKYACVVASPPPPPGGNCTGTVCRDSSLNTCVANTSANCYDSAVNKWDAAIRAAAAANPIGAGINTAAMLKAIMSQESNGRNNLDARDGKSFGAFQITPSDGNSLKGGCTTDNITPQWLKDDKNIQASACIAINFIKSRISLCGTTVLNLAAGYNGGAQGACGLSTSCASCSVCGGSPTRRWQCPWDGPDGEHKVCNVDRAGSSFNDTRIYAPKVLHCYNHFN